MEKSALEIINSMHDVIVLCDIERNIYITEELREDDKDTKRLMDIMDKYTYGWNVCEEIWTEQVKNINEFKKYIINNFLTD